MASTKTYPYNPSHGVRNSTSYNTAGQEAIILDPNDTYPSNSSSPHVPAATSTVPQSTNTAVCVENFKYVYLRSRKPVILTYCPKCAKQHVTTHTWTKSTGTTWLCVVAGVFIFWPLCWLPLVIKPMKQTNHYCNGCGTKVGRVKPFQ